MSTLSYLTHDTVKDCLLIAVTIKTNSRHGHNIDNDFVPNNKFVHNISPLEAIHSYIEYFLWVPDNFLYNQDV